MGNRPSDVHTRERSTTTIVTIIKGLVIAWQVEEFTRIHPKTWRWTTCRVTNSVADNTFMVRFPNVHTISMRNVKAKLRVDPQSGAVGAKSELEQA
jgi:hypothetical protein